MGTYLTQSLSNKFVKYLLIFNLNLQYKLFKNGYTLFKLGTIFIAVPYIVYLMMTEKGSGGILGTVRIIIY